MTRLGQMLVDEGIEQGMEKGMEKGMELKETESIINLMNSTHWTIDQAMEALKVPEDKREKYRQTIEQNN